MQVSIILPIRNEVRYISSTIDSILSNNNIAEQCEIIIVDGNSTDGSIEIIENFTQQYPFIKLINNPKAIVSTGFNLALSQSLGNIIVRIDGHCEISSNYLERCMELLNNTDADIVGGSIETISYGRMGEAIALAQSSWFGVGDVKFRRNSLNEGGYVKSLAFGAHRRGIFAEIGGYDEEMVCNQDDEFNFRAIQAGKKIWIDPTIRTKYYSRSGYSRLFIQYFNYGYYKIRGIQKRRQIISIRHLVPSLFVMGLFCTIFYGLYINNPIISVSVFFPYLICNFLSSIVVSQSVQIIPSIFISYWFLHLGYGIGFIWGFIRYIGKWGDTALKDSHFNKEQYSENNPKY